MLNQASSNAPAVAAMTDLGSGPYAVPPLPYAYDALAPVIDKETMSFHHDKHHQAYVDNLNKAVEAAPAAQGQRLEGLFGVISTLPAAVRNNGGGHWNHTLFWESMAAPDSGGQPSPRLEAAIVQSFGGLDAMKAQFEQAGLTRFGSGWAWLIARADGQLAVTSTPNQDNPLMDVAEVRGTPILGNDVWEHAYYLTYQNRRADYLKAWWRVVDWAKVSARYEAAVPGAG